MTCSFAFVFVSACCISGLSRSDTDAFPGRPWSSPTLPVSTRILSPCQEEADIARAIALSVANNQEVSPYLDPAASQDTTQAPRLAPGAATAIMDVVMGKAGSELQGSGDGVAAAIGGVAGAAIQPGAGQPSAPVAGGPTNASRFLSVGVAFQIFDTVGWPLSQGRLKPTCLL